MPVPGNPRIYHITHVDNLAAILAAGELWSDARVSASQASAAPIGITKIKQRRLALPVHGHTGLCVGACVPFYFCPRLVMLYLLHMGNHPEVTYRGGQDPIVHPRGGAAPVGHLVDGSRTSLGILTGQRGGLRHGVSHQPCGPRSDSTGARSPVMTFAIVPSRKASRRSFLPRTLSLGHSSSESGYDPKASRRASKASSRRHPIGQR